MGTDEIPSIIKDAPILYKMLVESTPLMVEGVGLNRMTINFEGDKDSNNNNSNSGQTSSSTSLSTSPSSTSSSSSSTPSVVPTSTSTSSSLRYIISRDENYIYLVQTEGF